MKRYRVPLVEVVETVHTYYVTVEANSEEEAIDLACLNEDVLECDPPKEIDCNVQDIHRDAMKSVEVV